MDKELLSALGEWRGFEVTELERKAGNPEEIWITLRVNRRQKLVCDGCGQLCDAIHDCEWRTIRDLPLFDARTFLKVHMPRVWCPRCNGPRRPRIDWLDRHQRVTRRLAESVARLCRVMTTSHVAAFFGLHWHTVRRIDASALLADIEARPPPDVRWLGMDEFALRKGHRYATVVVSLPRGEVLWVGHDRSRQTVRRFFEWLGTDRCEQVRAIAIDMNGAYEIEARAHCPKAEIVFDLFHVIAKYMREVIVRVRAHEARRLQDDPIGRRQIKSARWLLVSNRNRLSGSQALRLDELLAANQALFVVYVLKDDLKTLWSFDNPKQAARFWQGWYQRAMESGIEPLQRFARNLRPYLRGILAHCLHPIHTSILEGMNNRIKVLKRMAYGYRNDAYFFLKIRAAFPGNAR